MKIISDEDVFAQIKDKSKKAYLKLWMDFKLFSVTFNAEDGPPGEDILIDFFKHLRLVKKAASSSMWTNYSYLNSVLKRKYNFQLQSLPRLKMLLQGYETDVKKKAAIFDEGLLKFFMVEPMENNTYWEVRQAIAIVAFFGGLRFVECVDLKMEMFSWGPAGCTITHTRAKQRSDKMTTKFLVPQAGGFASKLATYINRVKDQLEIFQGKPWYTGRKSGLLVKQAMGKNMIAKAPYEIACRLALQAPEKYTFHSFRRTSATSAADGGSSTEQMVDFFGWKNGSMCTEYVSTSKPALVGMAKRLAKPKECSTLKEVVLRQPNQGEEEEMSSLDEDPLAVYSEAGIPFGDGSSSMADQSAITEASIKQAISSLPAGANGTVNIKFVVMSNMTGGNITL